MKIEKLYTYPIKGLRAVELDSATVTKHGFPYDRRFMLHEVAHKPNSSPTLKKMQVDSHPALVLFFPTLTLPSSPTSSDGEITITFSPTSPSTSTSPTPLTLTIPLTPAISTLAETTIDLHKSPTLAYRMQDHVNEWFSTHFGFEVVLSYLGPHFRDVLFTGALDSDLSVPSPSSSSLFSSLRTAASSVSGLLPSFASSGSPSSETPAQITFADCAPYLIVSSRSMDDIDHRLVGEDGEGEKMDITKFRPNIIVSAAERPWEEDYWRGLGIGEGGKGTGVEMVCVQNCVRCASLNVDYATGKMGTGVAGKVLQKLQKDRRVDGGMKWSPVVGRYAFVRPGWEGGEIRVGDEVVVRERNEELTSFDWKGLA